MWLISVSNKDVLASVYWVFERLIWPKWKVRSALTFDIHLRGFPMLYLPPQFEADHIDASLTSRPPHLSDLGFCPCLVGRERPRNFPLFQDILCPASTRKFSLHSKHSTVLFWGWGTMVPSSHLPLVNRHRRSTLFWIHFDFPNDPRLSSQQSYIENTGEKKREDYFLYSHINS